MPRKSADRSRLSAAQRRALLAAKAGKVVRKFEYRTSVLTSSEIGGIALWQLMRDHLIENGPIERALCHGADAEGVPWAWTDFAREAGGRWSDHCRRNKGHPGGPL